jgi:hypothetical protein
LQEAGRILRMRTRQAPIAVQAQTLAAADGENVEPAAAAGGAEGSAAFEQSRIALRILSD